MTTKKKRQRNTKDTVTKEKIQKIYARYQSVNKALAALEDDAKFIPDTFIEVLKREQRKEFNAIIKKLEKAKERNEEKPEKPDAGNTFLNLVNKAEKANQEKANQEKAKATKKTKKKK